MKFIFFGFIVISQMAQARVFDMTKEKFGSYLLFSGSQSNLKDMTMAGESAATSFTETYTLPVGGEFGFMYVGQRLGLRFGFEVLKPSPIEGEAKLGSAKLYHYRNDISALVPKIAIELNFKTGSWYRLQGFGFFGMANYVGKTDYSGLTIAPNVDHTVDEKSSANMYGGGVAMEFFAFDSTTFVLEGGYRQLKFTNMIYSKDITTFNGAHVSGDSVKNADGTAHQVDMTGVYAAVGLRFYLF